MIDPIHKKQPSLFYKVLCGFIALTFSTSVILPPTPVFAQSVLNLPVPGTMVTPSTGFMPLRLIGVTVHPENPLEFDFIINEGDTNLSPEDFKEESRKLIKYFLASLTVPEDELWVNLSPYEKDRMVPQGLGATEMGRDMLAQDYLLKQLTASLMYPEKELGKKFWDKIYKEAHEKYGTTEVPVNTFNKVWVVPQEAIVYEQDTSAYVVKSRLKVMLESDYEAMSHQSSDVSHQNENLTTEDGRLTTQIIKEVIIPAIEKEVNEGENFANLRQMYNSLILAAWYKTKLKDGLLGKVYVDQNKTKGIDTEDKQINQKIYDQYIESFKKGVYNYIKEDTDPATQDVIPRKYFSGGLQFGFGKGIIAMVSAALLVTAPVNATEFARTINRGENSKVAVVLGENPLKSAPETIAALEPAAFAPDFHNKNLVQYQYGIVKTSPGEVLLTFRSPAQTNNNDVFKITFTARNVPEHSQVNVDLIGFGVSTSYQPTLASQAQDIREGDNRITVPALGKTVSELKLSGSRAEDQFTLTLKEVILEKTSMDQVASASSPVRKGKDKSVAVEKAKQDAATPVPKKKWGFKPMTPKEKIAAIIRNKVAPDGRLIPADDFARRDQAIEDIDYNLYKFNIGGLDRQGEFFTMIGVIIPKFEDADLNKRFARLIAPSLGRDPSGVKTNLSAYVKFLDALIKALKKLLPGIKDEVLREELNLKMAAAEKGLQEKKRLFIQTEIERFRKQREAAKKIGPASSPVEQMVKNFIGTVKPLNDRFVRELDELAAGFSPQRLSALQNTATEIRSALGDILQSGRLKDTAIFNVIGDVLRNRTSFLDWEANKDQIPEIRDQFNEYRTEFQNLELILERGELENIGKYLGYGRFINLDQLPEAKREAASSPIEGGAPLEQGKLDLTLRGLVYFDYKRPIQLLFPGSGKLLMIVSNAQIAASDPADDEIGSADGYLITDGMGWFTPLNEKDPVVLGKSMKTSPFDPQDINIAKVHLIVSREGNKIKLNNQTERAPIVLYQIDSNVNDGTVKANIATIQKYFRSWAGRQVSPIQIEFDLQDGRIRNVSLGRSIDRNDVLEVNVDDEGVLEPVVSDPLELPLNLDVALAQYNQLVSPTEEGGASSSPVEGTSGAKETLVVVEHTALKAETMISIANKYGMTSKRIQELNKDIALTMPFKGGEIVKVEVEGLDLRGRTEDLVALETFGRYFVSRLLKYLQEQDNDFKAALKAIKMIQSLPGVDLYRGKLSTWDQRVAALSYYLFGQVLSEKQLIQRADQEGFDVYAIEQADFVFTTIFEMARERGRFSLGELMKKYREGLGEMKEEMGQVYKIDVETKEISGHDFSSSIQIDFDKDVNLLKRGIDLALGKFSASSPVGNYEQEQIIWDYAANGSHKQAIIDMINRGLTYQEAAVWYAVKQEYDIRFPAGFWAEQTTARNMILVVLDTIPGFKGARERNDIKTMADLYRKHVINFKGGRNGQTGFFNETGKLRGLMINSYGYLTRDGSAAALIRFVLPELIDVRNPEALDPLEVETDYWLNKDNAKYHIILALDAIPGFKDAREQNDIKTMADLYRKHVVNYKGKSGQNGQSAFFHEVGRLKGLMGYPRSYLEKRGSPSSLVRFAIPELIDRTANPDALDSSELEVEYWTDENNAKRDILLALDTISGFKEARLRGDIKTMADLYRQYVINYQGKQLSRNGQVGFFYEVGGLGGLMSYPRPYFSKLNSPAALIRFVLPELIDVRNPDALDPLEVENDYWADENNAMYHIILALDTIPEFKEARERGDIKTMAQLYRQHVINYRAKTYRFNGQIAFFSEMGLGGLMRLSRETPERKLSRPANLVRFAIPGLIDDANPDALKSSEVETPASLQASNGESASSRDSDGRASSSPVGDQETENRKKIIQKEFERVKKSLNIQEDIPLTGTTIRRFLLDEKISDTAQYANTVFYRMLYLMAFTKILREQAIEPTAVQQNIITVAQRLVKERVGRLGINYQNPPVVLVPSQVFKNATKLLGGSEQIAALYWPMWPTIFISSDVPIEDTEHFLIHEMLHANSIGLPERLLTEGATEYFTIKALLYRDGKDHITMLDIVEYLKMKMEAYKYKIDYSSEVLTILNLIDHLGGEGPLIDAYFKGDYASLEGMREWGDVVNLAHQYENASDFNKKNEWYQKTMKRLGLTTASSSGSQPPASSPVLTRKWLVAYEDWFSSAPINGPLSELGKAAKLSAAPIMFTLCVSCGLSGPGYADRTFIPAEDQPSVVVADPLAGLNELERTPLESAPTLRTVTLEALMNDVTTEIIDTIGSQLPWRQMGMESNFQTAAYLRNNLSGYSNFLVSAVKLADKPSLFYRRISELEGPAYIAALLPGTSGAQARSIILTAHFDAFKDGSDDNASGVAALMALAKAIPNYSFPDNIFIVFTNENRWGQIGAHILAKDLLDMGATQNNTIVVNIDAIGQSYQQGSVPKIWASFPVREGQPAELPTALGPFDLAELLQDAPFEVHKDINVVSLPRFMSDADVLSIYGNFPSITISGISYSDLQSRGLDPKLDDTIGKVDQSAVREIGHWLFTVLGKMAGKEGAPGRQDSTKYRSVENLQTQTIFSEDYSPITGELFASYGLSFATRHRMLKEEHEGLDRWFAFIRERVPAYHDYLKGFNYDLSNGVASVEEETKILTFGFPLGSKAIKAQGYSSQYGTSYVSRSFILTHEFSHLLALDFRKRLGLDAQNGIIGIGLHEASEEELFINDVAAMMLYGEEGWADYVSLFDIFIDLQFVQLSEFQREERRVPVNVAQFSEVRLNRVKEMTEMLGISLEGDYADSVSLRPYLPELSFDPLAFLNEAQAPISTQDPGGASSSPVEKTPTEKVLKLRAWAQEHQGQIIDKTRIEIAKEQGVSLPTLRTALKEFNIKTGVSGELRVWAEEHRGETIDETQAEIAEEYDVSVPTVSRIFSEFEIQSKGAGRPSVAQLHQWAQEHQEESIDKTQQEVADEYGVSLRTVNRIFTEFGIQSRGRHGRPVTALVSELRQWAQEHREETIDKTQAEVAEKYGISIQTVSRIFSEFSIQSRGPSREVSEPVLKLRQWAQQHQGATIDKTQPEVAEEYGVSRRTVSAIVAEFGIQSRGRKTGTTAREPGGEASSSPVTHPIGTQEITPSILYGSDVQNVRGAALAFRSLEHYSEMYSDAIKRAKNEGLLTMPDLITNLPKGGIGLLPLSGQYLGRWLIHVGEDHDPGKTVLGDSNGLTYVSRPDTFVLPGGDQRRVYLVDVSKLLEKRNVFLDPEGITHYEKGEYGNSFMVPGGIPREAITDITDFASLSDNRDTGQVGTVSIDWPLLYSTGKVSGLTELPKSASAASPVGESRGQKEASQTTSKAPGGIDLNPALWDLQIKRDGNGVPLPLPQQPIETMHIDGFVPIIINITPIPNLPMLLGLADTEPDTQQTRPDLKSSRREPIGREVEVVSYLN